MVMYWQRSVGPFEEVTSLHKIPFNTRLVYPQAYSLKVSIHWLTVEVAKWSDARFNKIKHNILLFTFRFLHRLVIHCTASGPLSCDPLQSNVLAKVDKSRFIV
ncbi:hypothetical protein XELAEV_18012610mg [Xenopus laevis]|uniref:Uncharacterized protein n=1 Tax=Xenopus laevis TaxID=8355 RepID=A0A974DQ89_XENLA|nr:hypothetical protein XELAEV_18012610mg [Xenopus laevis]